MCDVPPKSLTFEGRHNRSSPFPSSIDYYFPAPSAAMAALTLAFRRDFLRAAAFLWIMPFRAAVSITLFAKGDVLLVGCGSSYSFLDNTMNPGTDSGMSSSLLCVSFHGLYVGFYLRQLFHLPSVSFIPCYFTMFRFLWQEIFYNAVGLCKSRLFVKIKKMSE